MDVLQTTVSEDELTAAPIVEASRQVDVESSESESEEESGSEHSSSEDSDADTTTTRQSPSSKNTTDHHGLPYATVLPRHIRKQIKREVRRKKKPGK